MAKLRANKCNGCPLNVNDKCSKNKKAEAVVDFIYKGEERFKGTEYNGCGCFIALKKYSKENSQCPLGKWEDFKYE